MAARSQVERLPPPALAEVHAAIRDGDTVDEITRRMRAQGGTCSRAAVGRYVKQNRDALRPPAEDDDRAERRQAVRGEDSEGVSAGCALETLRGLVTRAAIAVEEGRKPPDIDQIGALALAIGRIENAGKAGAERESAAARKPAPLKGWPRSPEEQKKGLSLDAVAHIRAAVEGYWGPDTSNEEGEAAFQAHWEKRIQDAHDD